MDYVDDVNASCAVLPRHGGREGDGRTSLFWRREPEREAAADVPKHYRDCPTTKNFPASLVK